MDETMELIRRAREGDAKAKDKLVQDNLGLVWSIVRRFLGRGQEGEDLFQIGCIGLIKAIDHFECERELKLSTYAVPMIAGEIKRFLRDDGMIKVSRSIKENGVRVRRAQALLGDRLGREPTLRELSEEIGIPSEEIVVALEASRDVDSIDRKVNAGEGKEIPLVDRLVERENATEKRIDELAIQQLLDRLDEEERQLIELRYFQEKTQREIAGVMGITQVQASRMEKRILKKMRGYF